MGAKASKATGKPPEGEVAAATPGVSPPPGLPPGAANRRRRVSVSAEVDAAKGPTQKKVIPKTDEQLEDIAKAVSGSFLFNSLPKDQLKEVVDAMEEKSVSPGDVVIKEGGDGDYFYVIGTGELEVYIEGKNDGKPLRKVAPGDSFGELALMYNSPRTATVQAVTECQLWALDRTTFRNTILQAGKARREKYEAFLGKVAVLKQANLSSGEVAQLADAVEPMTFADGAVIIKEGEDDRDHFKFYIIEEGQADAFIQQDGEGVLMSVLGPGDYFGEKALLLKTPRTATVKAKGPLQCATLSIAAFERLMGSCADILKEREYDDVADVKSGRKSPRGAMSP